MLDVGALYETHWRPVYGFLRHRLPWADEAEVEDLTAVVFERVLRHADHYTDDQAGGLLRTIARNLLADRARRASVRREQPILDEAPGGRATTDAGSSAHLTELEVADALMQLPPRWRVALVEQHWLGASVADTALVLGVSGECIKAYRKRGRDRLQQLLEGERDGCPV